MLRTVLAAISVGLLVPAAAASAQAPAAAAAPAVGQKVYDAAGDEVGTITNLDGSTFVIDTGNHTATLALASLGSGPKGPVLGMTKLQLDAAINQAEANAAAALAAAMVIDAPVFASDGATQIGVIGELSDDNVLLKTADGTVGLPRSAVTKGANGLQIGMTVDQFKAAAAAAKQGAPDAAESSAAAE